MQKPARRKGVLSARKNALSSCGLLQLSMKTFRKITFWLHLISGVFAGIFIFIMCVTGALLSFESNILDYSERDMRVVQMPLENAQHLPIQQLIAKISEAKPNVKPSNITLQNDKSAAATVALGRDGQIFVNPYTGEITGEGAKNWRGFFRVVEDLHRWLAIPGDGRFVGKTLNDAANFLFLFLAVSGVYIWFPRRWSWKHFKAALTFRWKITGKARDFNWHTVIGFWSSFVLIILTATAVVMSYSWANNLVYTMTGSEPPPQQQRPPNAPNNQADAPDGSPENLDAIWTKAENYTTWQSIGLRLPIVKDEVVFTIDEGRYWNKFGRSTLTIDAKTGEVSKWESYGDQNAGRQLRSWIRFTHTGETGGFIGQLISFLACLGGAILVYTGFALAWRRYHLWLKKRGELDSRLHI